MFKSEKRYNKRDISKNFDKTFNKKDIQPTTQLTPQQSPQCKAMMDKYPNISSVMQPQIPSELRAKIEERYNILFNEYKKIYYEQDRTEITKIMQTEIAKSEKSVDRCKCAAAILYNIYTKKSLIDKDIDMGLIYDFQNPDPELYQNESKDVKYLNSALLVMWLLNVDNSYTDNIKSFVPSNMNSSAMKSESYRSFNLWPIFALLCKSLVEPTVNMSILGPTKKLSQYSSRLFARKITEKKDKLEKKDKKKKNDKYERKRYSIDNEISFLNKKHHKGGGITTTQISVMKQLTDVIESIIVIGSIDLLEYANDKVKESVISASEIEFTGVFADGSSITFGSLDYDTIFKCDYEEADIYIKDPLTGDRIELIELKALYSDKQDKSIIMTEFNNYLRPLFSRGNPRDGSINGPFYSQTCDALIPKLVDWTTKNVPIITYSAETQKYILKVLYKEHIIKPNVVLSGYGVRGEMDVSESRISDTLFAMVRSISLNFKKYYTLTSINGIRNLIYEYERQYLGNKTKSLEDLTYYKIRSQILTRLISYYLVCADLISAFVLRIKTELNIPVIEPPIVQLNSGKVITNVSIEGHKQNNSMNILNVKNGKTLMDVLDKRDREIYNKIESYILSYPTDSKYRQLFINKLKEFEAKLMPKYKDKLEESKKNNKGRKSDIMKKNLLNKKQNINNENVESDKFIKSDKINKFSKSDRFSKSDKINRFSKSERFSKKNKSDESNKINELNETNRLNKTNRYSISNRMNKIRNDDSDINYLARKKVFRYNMGNNDNNNNNDNDD